MALNITDNLDSQLAEIDYTDRIGFQGKVRHNVTKRRKNRKGAEARRGEAAKVVREKAKDEERQTQQQEGRTEEGGGGGREGGGDGGGLKYRGGSAQGSARGVLGEMAGL